MAEGSAGIGGFMRSSSIIDYASARHGAAPWNAEAAARPSCATRVRSAVSRLDTKVATSGSEQMLGGSGRPLKMQPPLPESIPMPAFPITPESSPRRSSDGGMSVSHRAPAGVPPTRSFVARQPSVGELLHAQGRCLPCRFQRQAGGCQKGAKCFYCHHHSHGEWSMSKTVKHFRGHICEYRATYEPWLESMSRWQDMS
eukprot:TRINITY_DN8077_c0_g1_i2.p1 TRINITY_DN8077_c0_g1~~TRINITY_DN8077_c0_g1_i2.p1  ORF type:complete len:232 (+),score=15.18 TRINITY_DN8077_c0_g1_i2:101-697(+)